MFPTKKKSSAKKEMQLFQRLFQNIDHKMEKNNNEQLFHTAIDIATQFPKNSLRIVVKRPLKGPSITDDRKPDFALRGKSNRYDVYMNNLDN